MQVSTRSFVKNAKKAMADKSLQKSLSKLSRGFPALRLQAMERLPEFAQLRDDAVALKDHIGGVPGDVGGPPRRGRNMGRGKGRSIVQAVPDHQRQAAFLRRAAQKEDLAFGAFLGAPVFNARLARHRGDGLGAVAGNQDHLGSAFRQGGDDGLGVPARPVGKTKANRSPARPYQPQFGCAGRGPRIARNTAPLSPPEANQPIGTFPFQPGTGNFLYPGKGFDPGPDQGARQGMGAGRRQGRPDTADR